MGSEDEHGAEITKGGSRIHRHEAADDRTWHVPEHAAHEDAIVAHLGRHVAPPTMVFHELLSDHVHLDVHQVPPADGRPFWTLFTTGMSALPMRVPEAAQDLARAELIVRVPASWPVDAMKQTPPPPDLERWYWPIRWLKFLARFPHVYQTWLGSGHTLPNGDPPEPLGPGTALCGWLLLPPVWLPREARRIRTPDGSDIHLYDILALHESEMNLKLESGLDALLDSFDSVDFDGVIDPDRRPVAGS